MLLAVRLYAEVVPLGASPLPWLLARVEGPVLYSSSRAVVSISYNDAGAGHSGDHWCWIVRRHWLIGPRVIAAGYVGADLAVERPTAWNWIDSRTLEGPPVAEARLGTRWMPRLPQVIDIGD